MQRYVPFGYQIQNGKAKIEPETAEFVREIFIIYLAGTSTYRIAKNFTQRGIWRKQIWHILRFEDWLEQEYRKP